jgi:hypothetical protein
MGVCHFMSFQSNGYNFSLIYISSSRLSYTETDIRIWESVNEMLKSQNASEVWIRGGIRLSNKFLIDWASSDRLSFVPLTLLFSLARYISEFSTEPNLILNTLTVTSESKSRSWTGLSSPRTALAFPVKLLARYKDFVW